MGVLNLIVYGTFIVNLEIPDNFLMQTHTITKFHVRV